MVQTPTYHSTKGHLGDIKLAKAMVHRLLHWVVYFFILVIISLDRTSLSPEELNKCFKCKQM